MPTFCRHGRRLDRCPICLRESGATEATSRPRRARATTAERRQGGTTPRVSRPGARDGLRVRRVALPPDDGYRHPLVPGIKATKAAELLADELAFAATRIQALAGDDPPGLYADVALTDDVEEATWLAFLIAYLGPLEGDEPFAAIEAARTSWASGELPDLEHAQAGPRGAHNASRGDAALTSYRAWAERHGGQQAAFEAESVWTPQRRFSRIYERLALPGFHRAARYDLLVVLGATGRYPLEADSLHLGGDDPVTTAAKRVFAIGDARELARRAAELASTAEIPIAALDLGLENWGEGERKITAGVGALTPDPAIRERIADALDL